MKQQIKCPHCNKVFPIEESLKHEAQELRKKLQAEEQKKSKERQKELEDKFNQKLEKQHEAHEKELAKIKNENIICWKNFSSEYCYFKNMNPFMNYNFIKTYEISNQHKYILTGLFRKYKKKGPTRFLEIKLIGF